MFGDSFVGVHAGTIISSNSPRAVIRHSSRQRLAPLKWWANERILFSPVSGTRKIVSSHSEDMPDVTGTVWTSINA